MTVGVMPYGAPAETAKKKPRQSSRTLPASGTAPGELNGAHIPVVCEHPCSKRWSAPLPAPRRCRPTTLLTSLAQLAGLAASLGFYQAASTESFGGGSGRLQRYMRTGNDVLGRGEGREANRSGVLWSGFQVCCFAVHCFSGDTLQPVGASGLVQKVWSVLGWESSCNCRSLDVLFNMSEMSPGVLLTVSLPNVCKSHKKHAVVGECGPPWGFLPPPAPEMALSSRKGWWWLSGCNALAIKPMIIHMCGELEQHYFFIKLLTSVVCIFFLFFLC